MPTVLSPRQLKELVAGEKVIVFDGTDPSTRQRVFPGGVPKKALVHFSSYCKRKLVVEGDKIHCFGTGGSKDVLRFAFQWMCAGGCAPDQRQMSRMDADTLIDLYRLAVTLDVTVLQTESQRLLGPAIHRLGTSEALSLYARAGDLGLGFAQEKVEGRLCYLLRQAPLDSAGMKFVYENTSEGSAVRTTAIKKLAAAVKWNGHDSAPYEEYCGENPKFNDDMIAASVPNCSHCNKVGHSKVRCYVLHPEMAPKPVVKTCSHCKQTGHLEAGCYTAHPELAPPEKVCEHCSKYGHAKAECFKLFPEKSPSAKFSCAHCGKAYHAEEACWVLHPELVPPPKRASTLNGRHRRTSSKGSPAPHGVGPPAQAATSMSVSLADYIKPAKGSMRSSK